MQLAARSHASLAPARARLGPIQSAVRPLEVGPRTRSGTSSTRPAQARPQQLGRAMSVRPRLFGSLLSAFPRATGHSTLRQLPLPRPTSRSISSLLPPTATLHSPVPLPKAPSIHRHLLFALAVGGGSLLTAAYWTNADTDERLQRRRDSGYWFLDTASGARGLDLSLARERMREVRQTCAEAVAAFPDSRLVTILAENYAELSEPQRTMLGLGTACGLVFVAWQLPIAQRVMRRYFLADPLKDKPVTMLTSIFSHKTVLHLAFNSIALYSVSTSTSSFLSFSPENILPRSTSRYELLALLITAGLASSLASHVWSCKVLVPRLIRIGMGREAVRNSVLPSLGASGAVYGCFAITALAFPDAKVSIIFLPFIPVSIGIACSSMVALDLAGLALGWKLFDHAAHLGGAAWGVLYWYVGHDAFERFRLWMSQV